LQLAEEMLDRFPLKALASLDSCPTQSFNAIAFALAAQRRN
jgi:hypothetical protein